jgi:hypothetical protein
MFRLQAVGQETAGQQTNGEIVPIDDLSYMPEGGWQNEFYVGFANVKDASARAKARQTVYRWYRIQCTAPLSADGQFEIAGYDGTVQGLWQVLPVENGLVDTYTDGDGIERPRPPQVAGIFWDHALDAKNIPAQRPYRGSFTLDARRGIVQFAEPVVQVTTSGTSFAPAELYLTVAHGVKDADTLQDVRYVAERALPGPGPGNDTGTGPAVFRRDDVVATIATQYDANNNPTGTSDNSDAIEQEAENFLDAAEAAFETVETDFVEYAGLVPINPDGAISQVHWSGGPAGTVTRAGRNSEFSLTVPTFAERRRAEQQRRQNGQSPTAADLSALKALRDYRGAR